MKSTGVTRRIDELGRIVVPKEIRRMLSIRDGENLEILVDGDKIILKKYLIMQSLTDLSIKLIDIFSTVGNDNIIITDREKVVATSATYKHIENKKISLELLKYIDLRESILTSDMSKISFDGNDIFGNFAITPIVNDADCMGLVIMVKSEISVNKDDLKLVKIISKILAEKISIS